MLISGIIGMKYRILYSAWSESEENLYFVLSFLAKWYLGLKGSLRLS